MSVTKLTTWVLLFLSVEGMACRRTAINHSTAEIKAVVEVLRSRKELESYAIEKVEIDKNRFTVALEGFQKTCQLSFDVTSDTACKALIEPVGKKECP